MHHILYHANCADGFAAACIARHALKGPLNLQPVQYGQPDQMPLGKKEIIYPGDAVTYLDYTPPQETLDAFFALHGDSIPLTIIDHHATAAERHGRDKVSGQPLEGSADTPVRFTSVFDLTRSGAGLAWDHFLPSQSGLPGLPIAIELIQWRDLGHAFDPKNGETPEIQKKAGRAVFDAIAARLTRDSLNLHAYLFRCLTRTFDAWTPLLLSSSTSLAAALQTGYRLREIDHLIILSAVANPHWLNFHGADIPAVNGLDAGLISDACTELLKAYPSVPFAASWFIDAKSGNAVYSLRSRRNSTVNVAEIAAAMAPGGGGHPNAAGFSTPVPIPFA